MPSAEIITIGTELLLGEILDSNAQHIAKELRGVGIDLHWTTTVGDNQARIAQAIQAGLARSDILICTGGLGPTIDDMSREGIAQGLGLKLEFQEVLWEEIKVRFSKFGRQASENNRRQAYVPSGAQVLDNPNGSAPAFLVEHKDKVIISLPGVPSEMTHILAASVLPYLRERYGSARVIKSRILHSAGIGESLIDERIADLEEQHNPTVGLAAHVGAVDIRLTAKASGTAEADAMLDTLEAKIRERLGDWIYGRDGESQSEAIAQELQRLNCSLVIGHNGFEDHFAAIFSNTESKQIAIELFDNELNAQDLQKKAVQLAGPGKIGLAAQLIREKTASNVLFSIVSPNGEKRFRFSYGGPQAVAPEWASKIVADQLRRYLLAQ